MRQAARREGVTLYRNHLDLAFDFRHRQCLDQRDRYFAIFGIIENDTGGKLSIAPDYTIPLEELHLRFTNEIKRIIDNGNDTIPIIEDKNEAKPIFDELEARLSVDKENDINSSIDTRSEIKPNLYGGQARKRRPEGVWSKLRGSKKY
jgi:hypothetical protein